MNKKSQYKWVILLLLVSGTAMASMASIVFAARAVEIMQAYRCNEAQLAALTTVTMLPGAVLSVPFGRLMDRLGCKRIMTLSILLTAAALYLRTLAGSYWLLLAFTLLAGIFFVPTGVAPAKMLYGWFEEREIPIAMGIYGSSNGLGSALGFASYGLFTTANSCFAALAIAALLLAAFWLLFGRERLAAPDAPASVPALPGLQAVAALLKGSMSKIMFCSFASAGGSFTLNTYLTRALTEKGATPDAAASLGMLLNLCMIFGGAIVGMIVARLDRVRFPYALLCLTGSAALLLAWLVPYGLVTHILFPATAFLLSGAGCLNMSRIALLPRMGECTAQELATANGLSNMSISLGCFLLPVVISSVARDHYALVFIIVFVLFILTGLVGYLVPDPRESAAGKRQQTHR